MEISVKTFYDEIGWIISGNETEDAIRFEDLRENSREYVSKCRLRVLKYIPDFGVNILDMASGPIQYKEYLEYSKNFLFRYCVDLSQGALDQAKAKIGDHGVFICGNFLDIDLKKNFFDCSVSLHTIYHIDKDNQDEVIRKLIDVTKPGKNIIIVYSNPNAFFLNNWIAKGLLRIINRKKREKEGGTVNDLYFYPHPNKWWRRFDEIATIKMVPWRSFDSSTQKLLIPNNKLGKKILKILYYLEERFPKLFCKYGQYPMIILTKRHHDP
ncbi:class I SAM-dependent methyltransferase [Methanospirillum lacunae]|uniref:class I SAM-dependent methyltransferase n=1 Tax=Methanospirillum lacunae TaxID=668570 RepID=UPI0015E82DB0|nr:class I SAM-dependent methyltransferase [Methanospirillum lacunae]